MRYIIEHRFSRAVYSQTIDAETADAAYEQYSADPGDFTNSDDEPFDRDDLVIKAETEMTSILDNDSAIRHARHDCGGTILTGANGTEQEHDYCDRCDWIEHRSERETWLTWRTDAASGGMWAASADAGLAQLIAEREWAAVDSAREQHEIADGAWLTIFDAAGVPVLRRGEMP